MTRPPASDRTTPATAQKLIDFCLENGLHDLLQALASIQKTGASVRKPGSGPHRKLTPDVERFILDNRATTATHIPALIKQRFGVCLSVVSVYKVFRNERNRRNAK